MAVTMVMLMIMMTTMSAYWAVPHSAVHFLHQIPTDPQHCNTATISRSTQHTKQFALASPQSPARSYNKLSKAFIVTGDRRYGVRPLTVSDARFGAVCFAPIEREFLHAIGFFVPCGKNSSRLAIKRAARASP